MRENDHLIEYFNAQARLGMSMQHPGGNIATHRLLDYFPSLKNTARILELGCGAGRTARILLDQFPCFYVGIDVSPIMLKRAHAFLIPYRSRVSLQQFDLRKGMIPFPDNSFDVVFAESVLALLDPVQIIPECFRVLKRGGLLAWNDRIWRNRVPVETQLELNEISFHGVGFHAAPLNPSSETDWRNLVNVCGLTMVAQEMAEQMPKDSLLSSLVRKARILTGMLMHPMSAAMWCGERKMIRKGRGQWKQMENWIFAARKSV